MGSGITEGLLIFTLLALATSLVWAGWAVLTKIDRREPVPDPEWIQTSLMDLAKTVDRNAADIDKLRLAVSDGIERVDRAEKRVQKTVASARRLVAENGLEHAGIEAEAAEIAERDDAPAASPEMPPLPEYVEPSGPTGIPGINRADLATLIELRSENVQS